PRLEVERVETAAFGRENGDRKDVHGFSEECVEGDRDQNLSGGERAPAAALPHRSGPHPRAMSRVTTTAKRETPSMSAARMMEPPRMSAAASGWRAMPSLAAVPILPMPRPAPIATMPAPIPAPNF